MKELTIEEKARRYDEALKAVKSLQEVNPSDEGIQNWVNENFPELKENEDERIRKELISYFQYMADNYPNDIKYAKVGNWIAWLEKQGTSYTKRDVDDAYLKGVTDTKNEIEKQYEANYQIRKDIGTFIFNYRGDIKDRAKWMDYLGIKVSFVEKQGEQKPAFDIDIPFGAKDSELIEESYCIPEGFHAEIEGNNVIIKKGEKKSAWSEDDELHIRELESLVKQVWTTAEHENDKDTIHKMSDLSFFLKTLKPQPKQEWSEEDKNRFINLISLVKCSKENNATKAGFIEFINKLKSLSLQNTWKPSDEQMKALSLAMCGVGDPLFSLYQDLEKLKG